MKNYFVTGIGTGIGKTVAAAVLVEKLKADYWKPVQAGDLDNSDTDKVRSLISNSETGFHPEAYRLNTPASPHAAAAIDGISIGLDKLQLPQTNNNLIIEGAGGLMVPLNKDGLLIADLPSQFGAEVVVISHNYLGSINHTLLTLNELKRRGADITGILFTGEENKETQTFIESYGQLPVLGRIPWTDTLDKDFILNCTKLIAWP